MRLTLRGARGWLGLWLRGQADGELDCDRVWRRKQGREAFRERCARLVVGHAVRHGGAWPQVVWAADGSRLAEGPLWDSAVLAASDWRLSGAAPRLIGELAARCGPEPQRGGALRARPRTAADLLLFDAVAEALDKTASGRERTLYDLVAEASPLTMVRRWDRHEPTPDVLDRLRPWLAAGWLVPFWIDSLVRDHLAIDRRRALLGRPQELVFNQRWQTILGGWAAACDAAGRTEALSLLPRLYGRWLAERDGAHGILRAARAGVWDGWTVQARERFEDSLGRLFAPALATADRAAELRGLGWQRTEAEEAFLGDYSRHLEPRLETLELLHRELCRLV